ncbi:MAG: alpha/beta fold hydrolase [Chloroflexota bacterium]|nr:alpha/beta fold hydrolase [Chloroflexota bacterium]
MTRALVAVLIASLVVLIAGCGSNPTPRPAGSGNASTNAATATVGFEPSFEVSPCPDDVSGEVVYSISCGYLTTLEDRSKPMGRTVRMFVVRIDPPGGATTPDPMIMVSGGTFGARPDYGGLGGRMHRVEYVIDPLGSAHSQPSLDCPEVDAVSPTLVGMRFSDSAHASTLRGAVAACHDRLVGQGIDLAAYDVAAQAADIEDLRVALGIGRWNAIAYGVGSRIAFEEARASPRGLRTIIVDSPTLPAPDLLTIAPAAMDLGISRLAAQCDAVPQCARRAPDLAAAIREAVARLDSTPLILDVDGTERATLLGHPVRVVVDGAGLLRWIRATLTDGEGHRAGTIITTVLSVLDGKVGVQDPHVLSLASDVGDCLGILPHCTGVSTGAMYSIVCRDLLPAIDHTRLDRDVAGRRPYAELFSPGPLGVACSAWSVPAAPAASPSIAADVPTLILRGWIDPFSAPPGDVAAAIAGTANAYQLEIPNQSYNALATGCPRTISDAWLDSPAASPADTSCLAHISPFDLRQ